MARKISSRLEDLDLSREELNRIGEALKKEEFRDLLMQYVREISDPNNKKKYEEEITQLENERGVDIKFVHPEPQYVLKTCFNPGGEKVFVNICSNSLVGKPTIKPSRDSKGSSGISWSIPLIQAPPREDLDKARVICTVYDVLFHPDTHAIAAKDKKFCAILEDTAMNAVEETFSVKLDRNSVKRPRMKFKGVPRPTVIRSRIPESKAAFEDGENIIQQLPYPYSMPPEETPCARELKCKGSDVGSAPEVTFIPPKYTLKQSSDVDMSNYEQVHLSHHDVTIPQRLVLIVDLPHVKSSSELDLDVEEQRLSLVSAGKRRYKLELRLAYPIQETKGNAKFDREAGKLIVTLLVDREKVVVKKCALSEGDSGVESDLCCGRGSSGSEEDERAMEGGEMAVEGGELAVEGGELAVEEEPAQGIAASDAKCQLNVDADDSVHCNSVSVGNPTVQLHMDEVMTGSGNLIKEACEEETRVEPTGNAQGAQFPHKVPEEGYVIGGIAAVKCPVTIQGLLLPGIQYTVPPFSCNCLREDDCVIITFVLQAKNVDPSSVKKKVINELEVPINAAVKNSSLGYLPCGISLAPENGSVCNEYRTVGMLSSSPIVKPSGLVIGEKKREHFCDWTGWRNDDNAVESQLSDKLRDSIVIGEEDESPPCDAVSCDTHVSCIHVIFSSVGAGFFPQNFAFCVGFPQSVWPVTDVNSSEAISVNIEVWDNNVEVQLRKSCNESGETKDVVYFVGKDPCSMQPYALPPFEEKMLESQSFSDPEFSSLTSVSEDLQEEGGTRDESDSCAVLKEPGEFSNERVLSASEKRNFFKERTLSESSVESVKCKYSWAKEEESEEVKEQEACCREESQ
ncbi:protein kintoun isoform X2 [Ischnura elegans]|uniref:protein kintoun isoform X2 n=1 Tax=Ischnura elegans TaxID=197161 RepID=UPI001ED8AC7B|nr:protein kintoun isoform X2 [Ischnura elegans]